MRLLKESVENCKRHYNKGDIIFKENDIGSEMFIILNGEVAIFQNIKEAQKVLMVLRGGATFGEMALVDVMPRSASARAKTNCDLLCIARTSLEDFMRKNVDFSIKLVKLLSSRLRQANKTISELLLKDREKIVHTALIRYAELKGLPVHEGADIKIAEFIKWAQSEIGLNEDELKKILKILLNENSISKSTSVDKAILIKV